MRTAHSIANKAFPLDLAAELHPMRLRLHCQRIIYFHGCRWGSIRDGSRVSRLTELGGEPWLFHVCSRDNSTIRFIYR
jgi:hypothetical protein